MRVAAYLNRILRVDLTRRQFTEETLTEELILNYLGGRGFGARFLYDGLVAGTDPSGPGNQLVFLTGPLAGTRAQSFNRWKIVFKSPLTGGYFKSSGGGHFAAEMKVAGFDAVIVSGASETPVYLWIKDGKYELRDADYLWGLTCDDTHTLIREELRDPAVRLACIGPAGERLVRYAGVFSDRRTAGRGGGGAVMGAKKLKAIAVRGHGEVPIARPDDFREAVREQIKLYRENPSFEHFSNVGPRNPGMTLVRGMFPTKNFRLGLLPQWQRIESEEYVKLQVRHTACRTCMVHCGKIARAPKGDYTNSWSEGPEYETIWGFTGPIMCTDTGLTIAADRLCDELGLDTISASGSIGFAYECYEKGLLKREDTDGLELIYGDTAPILTLLKKIAYREGIGDLLAEGTRRMAQQIGNGSDYFAVHVKGLELPAYDPRGAKAQGLNLMTHQIGADHNSGPGAQEFNGKPFRGKVVDRFDWQGKGALTKYNQDLTAVQDCGIMCVFPGSLFFRDDLAPYGKLLAAATGIDDFIDVDNLWRIGERINNLERMFNVREGFTRADDIFPGRILEETLPEGPSAGQTFEWQPMLEEYYRERGWDTVSGIPTAAKLRELGLGFTITD